MLFSERSLHECGMRDDLHDLRVADNMELFNASLPQVVVRYYQSYCLRALYELSDD